MVNITSYSSVGGLDLNSNPFTGTPGKDATVRTASLIADNCVLTRQRMIGNRLGFDYFTSPTPNTVDYFAEYQNTIIERESDGTLYQGNPTTGARTAYSGNYIPPSPYRMDSAVGRGSLFFTSTNGIQKLDAIGHQPIRAGISKGLDLRAIATPTANGLMNGFSKAGYHVTWVRTDANAQQVRGDVSTEILVTNFTRISLTSLTSSAGTATATCAAAHGFPNGSSVLITGALPTNYDGTFTISVTSSTTFTYPVTGSPTSPATTAGTITAELTANVVLAFTVPWDVIAGDSYEIWRTVTVPANNPTPGDNCFLVSSVVNAAAAGSTVSFTDSTSDTILQASTPLYTNATQEGALQGNARPPLATCTTNYKDYQIYGNTSIDYQITINCLAVVNFVPTTSTFIITDATGPRSYVVGTSENVSTQTFQQFSGGLSNASNIQQTVQSLCHVICGDPSGRWYAEYTSGVNDNPGIFRIWARQPLSGAFWITASNTLTGAQFSPVLPTTGSSVIATNDARPNRLFYSKFQEPDHCPVLNTIDAGRLDQPILRVLAVRDACYIIKADGVYYLSGLDAPFSMIELDSTCRCIAPASAVTLNNQIFMLSNQGVVSLSLSGVTVISFDIEPAIMVSALQLINLSTVSFGIAHESERQYILCLPTANNDTVATQTYVFHTFIQQWVRWTKPAAAGIALNVNYTLYISSGVEQAVLKQRNSGTQLDYSDETLDITIISQTGVVVTATWANSSFTPTAGISLHQGGSFAKVITATLTTGTTYQFTLDRTASYTAGAATARMPIYAQVLLSPNTCGQAGVEKAIYEVTFLLNSDSVTQATIEVATNEAPSLSQFVLTRSVSGGFGTSPWGTGWGDPVSLVKTIPWTVAMPIPDMIGETVSSGWIHAVSQEQFIIAQVAIVFDNLEAVTSTASVMA